MNSETLVTVIYPRDLSRDPVGRVYVTADSTTFRIGEITHYVNNEPRYALLHGNGKRVWRDGKPVSVSKTQRIGSTIWR